MSILHLFSDPSYVEIFQEIGRQVSERKKNLFKRSIQIYWAGAVWVFLYCFAFREHFPMPFDPNGTSVSLLMIVLLSILPLVIIYMVTMAWIFFIEKRIWIDSYFDKRNLKPEESWKIAKKLFIPAMVFGIRLIIRFFLIPIALLLFAYTILIPFLFKFSSGSIIDFIQIAVYLSIPVGIVWVIYSLIVKVRYSWFLFLDIYGNEDFSYSRIWDDTKKLNQFNYKKSRDKVFSLEIGSGILLNLTNEISQLFVGGMSKDQSASYIVGSVTSSVAREFISYAKLCALYLLYRQARVEVFGTEQIVNENIYKMMYNI